MSRCEQELCIHWAGDAGCPCDVFDLTPTGEYGQPLQTSPSGLEDEAGEDES